MKFLRFVVLHRLSDSCKCWHLKPTLILSLLGLGQGGTETPDEPIVHPSEVEQILNFGGIVIDKGASNVSEENVSPSTLRTTNPT